jgi:hypothetical protein
VGFYSAVASPNHFTALTFSSFDSSVSFTGKFLGVFYTILLEDESYTWPYFERGFTLNPDSIQSNFSGPIEIFYKQLAVVDHKSYLLLHPTCTYELFSSHGFLGSMDFEF